MGWKQLQYRRTTMKLETTNPASKPCLSRSTKSSPSCSIKSTLLWSWTFVVRSLHVHATYTGYKSPYINIPNIPYPGISSSYRFIKFDLSNRWPLEWFLKFAKLLVGIYQPIVCNMRDTGIPSHSKIIQVGPPASPTKNNQENMTSNLGIHSYPKFQVQLCDVSIFGYSSVYWWSGLYRTNSYQNAM